MATKIDKFIAEKTGMDPAEVQAKLEALKNDKNAQANNPEFMAAVGQYFNENNGAGKFDNPTQEQLAAFGAMAISDVARDNDFAQKAEEAMNRRNEQEAAKPPEQRQAEAQEKKAGIESIQEKMERMRAERAAQREAFKKSRQKPAETKPPEPKEPEAAKNDAPAIDQATIDEMVKVQQEVETVKVGGDFVADAKQPSQFDGPSAVKDSPEMLDAINRAGNAMDEKLKAAGIDISAEDAGRVLYNGNTWPSVPDDQFETVYAIYNQALLDEGVPPEDVETVATYMQQWGFEREEPEAPKNDAPAFDDKAIDNMIKVQQEVETVKVGGDFVADAKQPSQFDGPSAVKDSPEMLDAINRAGNAMDEKLKAAGIDISAEDAGRVLYNGNTWPSVPDDQFETVYAIYNQALLDEGVPPEDVETVATYMQQWGFEREEPEAPKNDTPAFDDKAIDNMIKVQQEVETAKVGHNEPPAGDNRGGKVNYGFVNDGPGIIIGGDTPNPYANGPEESFVNIGGDTPNPYASEPPVEDPTERWAKAKEDFDPGNVYTGLDTSFADPSSTITIGDIPGSKEMAGETIEKAGIATNDDITNRVANVSNSMDDYAAQMSNKMSGLSEFKLPDMSA